MRVRFTIQKVEVGHYLEGAKVMVHSYDTYKTKVEQKADTGPSGEKIRQHIVDTLLAGVVEPKLARKPGEDGVLVDKLFTEPMLAIGLYEKINEFTFGKKKLRNLPSVTL